jgi:hypothetical protein
LGSHREVHRPVFLNKEEEVLQAAKRPRKIKLSMVEVWPWSFPDTPCSLHCLEKENEKQQIACTSHKMWIAASLLFGGGGAQFSPADSVNAPRVGTRVAIMILLFSVLLVGNIGLRSLSFKRLSVIPDEGSRALRRSRVEGPSCGKRLRSQSSVDFVML